MSEIVLYGTLIGYQFNKKSLGQRVIKRNVTPLVSIKMLSSETRTYGNIRWNGYTWLCVLFSGDRWFAVDIFDYRKTTIENETVYKLCDERDPETGKLLKSYFYKRPNNIVTTEIYNHER